jgi:hypothetical protein
MMVQLEPGHAGKLYKIAGTCIHLVSIFCRWLINNAYATFQQRSSPSVYTSVKKAYVHWVFKNWNPTIHSILFSSSARYCTSPLHHPYNVQPVSKVCGVL